MAEKLTAATECSERAAVRGSLTLREGTSIFDARRDPTPACPAGALDARRLRFAPIAPMSADRARVELAADR